MAKVRYVILVPTVVEDDVTGSKEFIGNHGHYLAKQYPAVETMHPKGPHDGFTAILAEAIVLEDDEPLFDMEELIAPGA